MKKIEKWIYKIIADAIRNEFIYYQANELKRFSDTARLIVDAKNNNLSLQSRDFLMRMNIHPDEFLKPNCKRK